MSPDDADTPFVYARRIAYMTCPSTIRARTLNMFGIAPSLEECARYRADYLAETSDFKAKAVARSGGAAALPRHKETILMVRNAAIIAAYKSGKSTALVAREYGLSTDHVGRIVHRSGASRVPPVHTSPEQKQRYTTLCHYVGPHEARKAMGL